MSTAASGAAHLLRTLGDETRLQVLLLLQRREFCVCELVDLFPISQPAVSGHLRRLRDAGLVRDERRGMWVYYRAADGLPPLVQAILDEVALPPALERACADPGQTACRDVVAPAAGLAAPSPARRMPADGGAGHRAPTPAGAAPEPAQRRVPR